MKFLEAWGEAGGYRERAASSSESESDVESSSESMRICGLNNPVIATINDLLIAEALSTIEPKCANSSAVHRKHRRHEFNANQY